MAKKQTFAEKAAKKKAVINCPVCESPVTYVKYAKAERSPRGWKFRTINVGVCKCNHAEIYG